MIDNGKTESVFPDGENEWETSEETTGKKQEVVSVYYEAPPADTEVVGIRFRSSGKIYYFDPDGVTYHEGCHAIVETTRGQEYGFVAQANHIVSGKDIVLPLRKALRIATPADDMHDRENLKKAEEAFLVGNKKIAEHGLDMKLIDTEYTFDNSKLLFYFTSEDRVDFRDLVKDLAAVFRCRIELRQMGIRDEAKVLGGLGTCGRSFCCHAFLPDFVQVSIKMAKEQNLSLNSAKISGACGRLMCCLRYEYDTYLEEGRLTPKVDSLVNTPDGIGVVMEAKPLVGLVKVRSLDDTAGAPKVYHRDQLSPIKKGDENYEKALEEKTLEKQARAVGTTRAALKAARIDPEKAAAKAERIERALSNRSPAPQRASSYTGQVTPSALQSAKENNDADISGIEPLKEQPFEEQKENREKGQRRGRNARRRGRSHAAGGETKAPAEKSEEKTQKQPRYEMTSRREQPAGAPRGRQIIQENKQTNGAAAWETPENNGRPSDAAERARRSHRPHHKKRGGNGEKQDQ